MQRTLLLLHIRVCRSWAFCLIRRYTYTDDKFAAGDDGTAFEYISGYCNDRSLTRTKAMKMDAYILVSFSTVQEFRPSSSSNCKLYGARHID